MRQMLQFRDNNRSEQSFRSRVGQDGGGPNRRGGLAQQTRQTAKVPVNLSRGGSAIKALQFLCDLVVGGIGLSIHKCIVGNVRGTLMTDYWSMAANRAYPNIEAARYLTVAGRRHYIQCHVRKDR